MDKQNVVCIYTGKILNHKKEGSSDTCYKTWINLQNMLSEIRQTQKDKYCMIPLLYTEQANAQRQKVE